ncbi:MAG: HD domain-containing phosphohydrolase [Bdellovibrionota bacterium]
MRALNILFIGVDGPLTERLLRGVEGKVEVRSICRASDFEDIIFALEPTEQDLIICSNAIAELSPAEIAQATRTNCPQVPMFYITCQAESLQIRDLKKNGFNEVFFIPSDLDMLGDFIRQVQLNSSCSVAKRLKPVSMLDFGSEPLEFDVSLFLPANNKYLKIAKSGTGITDKHLSRLKSSNVASLYVNQEDLGKYFSYVSQRLKSSTALDPEAKDKNKVLVRNLFIDVLSSAEGSFEDARSLLDSSRTIVSTFIAKGLVDNINDQLLRIMGDESGSYAHAYRTASYATLLSNILEIGRPEIVGIAALFHDVSLLHLESAESKDVHLMPPELQKIHLEHPLEAVKTMQSKRMVIDKDIKDAIEQHHERPDGKGFPKGLVSHRISDNAQILSLASQLDEHMTVKPGKKRYTPLEAIKKISENGSIKPEIITKTLAIFKISEGVI